MSARADPVLPHRGVHVARILRQVFSLFCVYVCHGFSFLPSAVHVLLALVLYLFLVFLLALNILLLFFLFLPPPSSSSSLHNAYSNYVVRYMIITSFTTGTSFVSWDFWPPTPPWI